MGDQTAIREDDQDGFLTILDNFDTVGESAGGEERSGGLLEGAAGGGEKLNGGILRKIKNRRWLNQCCGSESGSMSFFRIRIYSPGCIGSGSVSYSNAKLGNKSDEAMKRCDEALNASLLQFLC